MIMCARCVGCGCPIWIHCVMDVVGSCVWHDAWLAFCSSRYCLLGLVDVINVVVVLAVALDVLIVSDYVELTNVVLIMSVDVVVVALLWKHHGRICMAIGFRRHFEAFWSCDKNKRK